MLHAAAGGSVRGCFEQEMTPNSCCAAVRRAQKARSRIHVEAAAAVNATLNSSRRKSEIRTVGSTHTFQQCYCLIDCGDSLSVSVALVQSQRERFTKFSERWSLFAGNTRRRNS